MEKILLIFCIGILIFNFTSAINICIDHDPPTWNASFTATSESGSVFLNWEPAIDIPDCSGIDYYDIYRSSDSQNFIYIASTQATEYLDENLSDGTYQYMIHAFDLAGHNEGGGLLLEEVIVQSNNQISPGGSPSSSEIGHKDNTLYFCGDWSECEEGMQQRTCSSNTDITKNESRTCFPDFIPLGQETEDESILTSTTEPETAGITGSVIGFVKSGKGIITLIFATVIIAAGILVVVGKKRV